MKNICNQIQQQLADSGSQLLKQHNTLRKHINTCDECSRYLESLKVIEDEINNLPEYDASDALVNKTLELIQNQKKSIKNPKNKTPTRVKWASGFASIAVVLAAVGLMKDVLLMDAVMTRQNEKAQHVIDGQQIYYPGEQTVATPHDYYSSSNAAADVPAIVAGTGDIINEEIPLKPDANVPHSVHLKFGRTDNFEVRTNDESSILSGPVKSPKSLPMSQKPSIQPGRERLLTDKKAGQGLASTLESKKGLSQQVQSQAKDLTLSLYRQQQGLDRDSELRNKLATEIFKKRYSASKPRKSELEDDRIIGGFIANDKEANELFADTVPAASGEAGGKGNRDAYLEAKYSNLNVASNYLANLESVEGLHFQDAAGYWANTYIPGDPLIRLLETKLQDWDRGGMQLEQVAYQNWQPYDAPNRSALTTYVHADKRSIEGPTRIRLQVGIKATQRKSGQRPPMNIGVVLDLRDLATSHDYQAQIEALLKTLNATKQSVDRFSLIVAGRNGGTLIHSGQFRHGSLQVALSEVFKESSKHTQATSLVDALHLAAEEVSKADLSTLSERMVLMVTPGLIHGEFETVKTVAHQNAVAGIPMSVVGLGNKVDLTALDELILIAQGRRRLLLEAPDASRVIEQELLAASQVVARIVRLSIKLAPGVKLIDVPGSKRLDVVQTEQTKEVEKSTDQRISQYLGIQADRGDDEEGIQIVIPFMESGAAHTVLVDVLAEKPGEIADIRVRYKDLISLNNGVARAKLNIQEGNQPPGLIEQNVTKNLLAVELADSIRSASQKLAEGDSETARHLLIQQRDLLNSMRQVVADWQTDPELLADENMLNEYLAILNSPVMEQPEQVTNISDSLAIGAHRKMLLSK